MLHICHISRSESMLFVLSPCNSFDKIRRLSGKLSSLPATFQALGVLVSYAVGLALDWHQLAWFSFYFAFPIPISSFSPFWTRTRLTSTGMVLLSSYSLSLSSVFCNHQLVTHFLNLAWIWIICSSQPIIFGNHHGGGSCLVGLFIQYDFLLMLKGNRKKKRKF